MSRHDYTAAPELARMLVNCSQHLADACVVPLRDGRTVLMLLDGTRILLEAGPARELEQICARICCHVERGIADIGLAACGVAPYSGAMFHTGMRCVIRVPFEHCIATDLATLVEGAVRQHLGSRLLEHSVEQLRLLIRRSADASPVCGVPPSDAKTHRYRARLAVFMQLCSMVSREVGESSSAPAVPDMPGLERAVRELKPAARELASSGLLSRYDFLGRLYHRLLVDVVGKKYASYYTGLPAATLLANLALFVPHDEWDFTCPDWPQKYRVLDPACGSGTLLSAVYVALRDVSLLGQRDLAALDRVHLEMLRSVISGWDILDDALYLSRMTMRLHAAMPDQEPTRICKVACGQAEAAGVQLGSLHYLDPDIHVATDDLYDLILMNPPFSRSAKPNTKFGYCEDGGVLTSRSLRRLTRKIGVNGIGHAGLGAYFMLLALRLVRRRGRVGAVIPRSSLSGVAWAKVRERYLNECNIRYIISTYDPGHLCWSENTGLGEIMLLAEAIQPTEKGRDSKWVTYANIYRRPANSAQASALARQILRASQKLESSLAGGEWASVRAGDNVSGVVYRVAQQSLRHNWLAPCVFAQPQLNAFAMNLASDSRLLPLGSLATSLGADIKAVKQHFTPTTDCSLPPVIWGHQAAMNTICMTSEHIGRGTLSRGHASAEMHRRYSSCVLLAERPHLSTEALLAQRTRVPAIATAFWEIRLRDRRWEPFFLLWANSTYGLLLYLQVSTSSMGDIFKMKKEQVARLPILDPEVLDERLCLDTVDRLGTIPLRPFASEFGLAASNQGVRVLIDRFLQTHLALPDVSLLYALLAREPVICKRPLS